MQSSDVPERLVSLVGQAVVEWSKIEAVWAGIFLDLIYQEVTLPRAADERPPDRRLPRERAKTLYFGVKNSAQQRQRVVQLATGVLRERRDLIRMLRKMRRKTDSLSLGRNGIVHAFYDRPMTSDGNVIIFGEVEMLTEGRTHLFQQVDPLVAIPQRIAEFKAHELEMIKVYFAVAEHLGLDAGDDQAT